MSAKDQSIDWRVTAKRMKCGSCGGRMFRVFSQSAFFPGGSTLGSALYIECASCDSTTEISTYASMAAHYADKDTRGILMPDESKGQK